MFHDLEPWRQRCKYHRVVLQYLLMHIYTNDYISIFLLRGVPLQIGYSNRKIELGLTINTRVVGRRSRGTNCREFACLPNDHSFNAVGYPLILSN